MCDGQSAKKDPAEAGLLIVYVDVKSKLLAFGLVAAIFKLLPLLGEKCPWALHMIAKIAGLAGSTFPLSSEELHRFSTSHTRL